MGEVNREKIPVTGNSRFGCWCCTMVKEDKSLQNFINKGAKELIPLREFRNELLEMRENSQYRDSKRRNGSVYKKSDGSFGMGPFTLEARRLILEKLLDLENRTGMELITEGELKVIDKMWDEEGDLTCRTLVETYHKVKGKKLPWDDYKTPRFDDEAIQAIRDVADKQQPCREEHQAVRHRAQEFPVRQHAERSAGQRRNLQPHRYGEGERLRPVQVPDVGADGSAEAVREGQRLGSKAAAGGVRS